MSFHSSFSFFKSFNSKQGCYQLGWSADQRLAKAPMNSWCKEAPRGQAPPKKAPCKSLRELKTIASFGWQQVWLRIRKTYILQHAMIPLWYSLEVLCLDLTTELLLMDKILHRQGWWLSPLLTRLYIYIYISKVVSRISSINSMAFAAGVAGLRHWLKDALPSLGQRTTRLGETVLVWFGWFFLSYIFWGKWMQKSWI